MNDTKEMLATIPFWEYLSETEQQEVLNSVYVKHYDPGTMLYGAGDESYGLMYIIEGEIRAYLLSEGGREITLYRLQSEELGLLTKNSAISQISFETYLVTVKDTDILVVPPSLFDYLAERNIYVKCFSYELASQRFSVIMWVMQQILFSRFDQRLASFLMEEYRRTECEEISMTQEQIAEYVNSAREVVARMLRQFASDGLIENRRGVIVLKDIPALQELGASISIPESITKSS